ncbi:PREDICTED: uncharacterized protein LOC109585540 [Amphimedon queenslandica]|uniref:Uncharacterized protein n=1 Tax=Amphimedon queenslandica TaxID=400682 RepID=A0AAN0JJS5_AMPQE|nr:PREDICTED: uncharacterized protein LOC109585540 [Amphimedon queenslandica]|eukprot:XP_019857224.1 PREDICTED: uncharacterized protein LOC109585540 [Amphimedon queenslandica]
MDLKENTCSLEQKLGELQNNESYLKGQLEMKDKIIRVAIMEKEKMDDKMRNLKEQQQKEIKTFQDKILSLRLQLLQNQGGTASKETAIEKETTNQPVPIPQQQEYDPHTENISVSNSEITLTTPVLKHAKKFKFKILSYHYHCIMLLLILLLQFYYDYR